MTIVVLQVAPFGAKMIPVQFDVIPETDSDAKLVAEWHEEQLEGRKEQAARLLAKVLHVGTLVVPNDWKKIGTAKMNQAKVSKVLKKRLELIERRFNKVWQPSTLSP